jgi:hypothetical protein
LSAAVTTFISYPVKLSAVTVCIWQSIGFLLDNIDFFQDYSAFVKGMIKTTMTSCVLERTFMAHVPNSLLLGLQDVAAPLC